MKFNPSKCQCISFSNSQTPIKFGYTIHNNFIQNLDSIKYLGVTIDRRITWTEHIDRIVLKANRVKGYVYQNFRKYSVNVKTKLYKTLIQPIM